MKEIIKKSLFTERQIEIILTRKKITSSRFEISKGAYFRQVSQCRNKLKALYYSMVLLQGLGIISPDDMGVISQLSGQVSMLKDRDVFPEREADIIDVIDKVLTKKCGM